MNINQKAITSIIIIILLIQLVIGTPFSISIADEIITSDQSIDTIAPVDNTVLSQETTETIPLEVLSGTEQSSLTGFTG